MECPSTLADSDALIAREDTTDGPRFVVHSRRGPQLACRTYAQAEAHAIAYAEPFERPRVTSQVNLPRNVQVGLRCVF